MISAASVPISDQIGFDQNLIDGLINDLVKKDAKDKTKQLLGLLIEYIIENMKGDIAGAKAASDKISSLVQSLGTEVDDAHTFENDLKAYLSNPANNTPQTLAALQALIVALEKALNS